MALAPDVQPLDRGFLARQRARLEDEREGLMRVLEELASQIAALIRHQEAGEAPEGSLGAARR